MAIDIIVLLVCILLVLVYIIFLQERKMDRLIKDIIHYRNQSNKWRYLYKNFCNVENDADAEEKPSTNLRSQQPTIYVEPRKT